MGTTGTGNEVNMDNVFDLPDNANSNKTDELTSDRPNDSEAEKEREFDQAGSLNADAAEYGADQIQILEGLEAVRKRPGMYIGSTSARGLHHLVYEIVDNAIDEALAGFCDYITVTIHKDNSVTVTDNGRGIPVGINHKAGLPAVEVVFTVLHAGGKFGGGGYKVSGGLHGVGASVVNALSNWLEVQIFHEGKIYQQRYERGKVMYPLKVVGDCEPEKTGTVVTFFPDDTIFDETVFDFDTLKNRLREMAFLTKGIKIVLRDEREEELVERTFHYEGGIKEFVTYLNKGKAPLYEDIIFCEGMKDNVYVEVAMQHNDSYTDSCYSFVNNITTPEGGMHLTVMIEFIIQSRPALFAEASLADLVLLSLFLFRKYALCDPVSDISMSALHRQISRQSVIRVYDNFHIRRHLHRTVQHIHRNINLSIPIKLIAEKIRQHHIIRLHVRKDAQSRRLINLNTGIVRVQCSVILCRQHESSHHTRQHIRTGMIADNLIMHWFIYKIPALLLPVLP